MLYCFNKKSKATYVEHSKVTLLTVYARLKKRCRMKM